jgi:PAS domain S-box-containing protein
MNKRSRPELDPEQLREIAELTVAALPGPQPPAGADSEQLRRWHELQVSQIELDMQTTALAELQHERDQAEAGRDRYAALYDQAPAGYLSLDENGRITRANHAAAELLACRRDELPGKHFEQFVAPQAQAALRRFLAELFASGHRAVLEAPLFDPHVRNDADMLRQVHIEANLDAVGRKCRMILTDIGTADMREAARRRAFQVLDSIGEGVLVCDIDQNIVSVNRAFTVLTGYPVEEALGRNPRFLGRAGAHPPGYHSEAMRCLRTYGKWQGVVYNRRRDGTPYSAHMSLTVIRDDAGKISYFIGVFSDITARQQAESDLLRLSHELDERVEARTAELTESREQLRQLAEHLETVKEEERKRIARDIHDELGQNLLALRIDISMLSARTGERHMRLHRRVEAVLENVDNTIRNVRYIMNELRPAVLDLGLQAALEWQAAEFRKRGSLDCADEGQWQPHQLPQLKSELKRIGITIPAEKLADLSKHPMSAIVSLGGCSASFVSPDGLVVTNHHCAYGAIQRNSTPEHNYIVNGFLAKTRAEELPGGPNTLVYVTEKVENVTDRVLKDLSPCLSGKERHEQVESRIKALIAECESDKAYRCSVPAFHRGLEYYRIRQLMIRDVRLVYAPADRSATSAATSTTTNGRARPATSPSCAPTSARTAARPIRRRTTCRTIEGLPGGVGRGPEERRSDPAGRLPGPHQPLQAAVRNPLRARRRLSGQGRDRSGRPVGDRRRHHGQPATTCATPAWPRA